MQRGVISPYGIIEISTEGFGVLIILLSLLSAPAFAADDHPEWYGCRANDDCVVAYACASVAVNKKYRADWEATRVCTAAVPPVEGATAACKRKRCVLVVPPKRRS